MQKIDKRFLLAVAFTTIMMVGLYFVLLAYGQNYADHMKGTLGGVEKVPLIVIGTILNYWWILYGVMVGLLTLRWVIKRIFAS